MERFGGTYFQSPIWEHMFQHELGLWFFCGAYVCFCITSYLNVFITQLKPADRQKKKKKREEVRDWFISIPTIYLTYSEISEEFSHFRYLIFPFSEMGTELIPRVRI